MTRAPKVLSLFSGCGGLDLGFAKAGFDIVWANEHDKTIWPTYRANHPQTHLQQGDLRAIPSSKMPDVDGVIGGPPCQSWSAGGASRGIHDPRGKLFHEYLRVIREKNPLFFVAENVPGILGAKHNPAWQGILQTFRALGYELSYQLLNAKDFQVPQDRRRVILVGFRQAIGVKFRFPKPQSAVPDLQGALSGLTQTPAKTRKKPTRSDNHEYLDMDFSPRFMSRNRTRAWNEPSFTLPATARHVPLHPDSGRMLKVGRDRFVFTKPDARRFSVRECARIQTFPDSFLFHYQSIEVGYKMIGNAVPVNLARAVAAEILAQLP
jgi:DNA (cytosine-5)-methyltransferase 1